MKYARRQSSYTSVAARHYQGTLKHAGRHSTKVIWQDTTKRHSSMQEDRVQRSCGKTLLRNSNASGQSTEGYVASHYQDQRQAIVHEGNVRIQVMWQTTAKAQLIQHTRRQRTHALCQDTINLPRQTLPRDKSST